LNLPVSVCELLLETTALSSWIWPSLRVLVIVQRTLSPVCDDDVPAAGLVDRGVDVDRVLRSVTSLQVDRLRVGRSASWRCPATRSRW